MGRSRLWSRVYRLQQELQTEPLAHLYNHSHRLHRCQASVVLPLVRLISSTRNWNVSPVRSSSIWNICAGSSGTSSSNGSSLGQNNSNSLSQMGGAAPSASQTQKTKSTFSDDMHQLVDNFARDAKKGPKTGSSATLGLDVSLQLRFLWDYKQLISCMQ